MDKIVIAATVFAIVSVGALTSYAATPIDLNAPGNLEAIERDYPTHFAKIRRILAEVQRHPTEAVLSWMLTDFEAREVPTC